MKRREVLQAGMALGGLAGLGRALAQGGFTLTLVHTNDTHAHLEPVELTLSGEKTPVGGVARRVALFDRVWARAKNPLFLDAGDVFQGTLYFNQYRGLADRYFMHRLRYRAMALGNHEFDLGPGPLADFLKGARFKVVSANVDASREPRLKGLFAPYAVVVVGGERVGIIGLTTPDTREISNPGPTVAFLDPYESAQKAVYELLAKGVNKIVVLSHLGYGEDLKLARRLVGAQVIVGGHSHTLLGSFPHKELSPAGPYPTVVKNPEGKDVLVVQAWEWGKVVGLLEVTFDAKGELLAYKGEALLMTPEAAPEDFFAKEALLAYAQPVMALMQQVIAEARVDLVGERAGAQAGEQPGEPHHGWDALEDEKRRDPDRPAKRRRHPGLYPQRPHHRGQGLRGPALREHPGGDGPQGQGDLGRPGERGLPVGEHRGALPPGFGPPLRL